MLDSESAKRLATEEINRGYNGRFGPLVILEEETIEKEYGWIFFYSTKKFAETRQFQYALAGSGPLVVERSGVMRRFGSGKSPAEVIREYEISRGYTN